MQSSIDEERTATGRSRLRNVAVPTEHGGWSLTLEPTVLGLLVAWSWPGLALGVVAMMAFVARTPVKLVLVDRWRGRRLARTGVAARAAAVEIATLAVLLLVAARWADGPFWVPLLLALPLLSVELWFDMRSRGRRLVPELAGTVGIGAVAPAIALAGGADGRLAVGLWVVVAARGVTAVPYARTQVLRGRGSSHHLWHSDLAQAVAAAAVVVGWLAGAVTVAAALAITFVGTFNVTAVRLAPRPAKTVGLQQMFYGIAVVLVTAESMRGHVLN